MFALCLERAGFIPHSSSGLIQRLSIKFLPFSGLTLYFFYFFCFLVLYATIKIEIAMSQGFWKNLQGKSQLWYFFIYVEFVHLILLWWFRDFFFLFKTEFCYLNVSQVPSALYLDIVLQRKVSWPHEFLSMILLRLQFYIRKLTLENQEGL